MQSWAEELLTALDGARGDAELFCKIDTAARSLGFEYCAYGLRVPFPMSNPKIYLLNNYPVGWQMRYREAGYLDIDPTVAHGRRTQAPLVWSDNVFARTPDFWAEARSFGLRVGWAQSNLGSNGVGGMLSLARSGEPLSAAELDANELKMRWLANIAHLCLSRVLAPKLNARPDRELTNREVEILKWAADGKTSGEISEILVVSVDTVNFHVKNAMIKLKAANKTAAVARAAMLGLFN